jgi:ASPIC and UnbV
LGDATTILSLEILWPGSGTRQRFEAVGPGKTWEVVEGRDTLVELKRKTFRLGGP